MSVAEHVLTFHADGHRYYLGAEELPSVTTVLEAERLLNFGVASAETMEYARDLGTQVHSACELDDQANLREEALDPAIAPYLAAWRRFRKEARFVPNVIEQRVFHPQYRYAGQLDRLGHFLRGPLTRSALSEGVPAIVDLKTGQPQRATGYQLAAYLACLPKSDQQRMRFGCYLRDDGTYSLVEYAAREDLSIFLAAFTVYNARRRHA